MKKTTKDAIKAALLSIICILVLLIAAVMGKEIVLAIKLYSVVHYKVFIKALVPLALLFMMWYWRKDFKLWK